MKNRITSFFPSLTISSPLFHLPLSSLFLTSLTVLTVLSANAQVPSYVPTNGLVGYWPFNGNANDESGNGNNGTVNGATLAADRFGDASKAYEYGNIDCQITTNACFNASSDFTYSCWYLSNTTSSQILINTLPHTVVAFGINPWWMGENYTSFLYGSGQSFGWYNNGNNLYLSPNPLLNQWVNFTVVKSGWNWVFYENGVITHSHIASLQPLNQLCQLIFGHCDPTECQETFTGTLDDIAIWNRALTADEVLALYNGCNVTPQVVTGNTTPSAFANSTYTCNNTVGSTYTWAVNNGVIVSGQGTNSVTILWGAEGVGSVSVAETTSDGCVGDEVIYDVNVQCVVSGNEITGPVGPEAFSNSTYTCNGAANSTYNWTVTNGVIASGQGTNTVNILWASTGLGNISVVETTAEGCTGTTLSQDVVVIPTNVEELANQLILYPNPVTTSLTLQVKSEMIGSDFVVFDALGKVVLRDKILSSNQNISVINLSNGNYILRVGAMNKAFTISK